MNCNAYSQSYGFENFGDFDPSVLPKSSIVLHYISEDLDDRLKFDQNIYPEDTLIEFFSDNNSRFRFLGSNDSLLNTVSFSKVNVEFQSFILHSKTILFEYSQINGLNEVECDVIQTDQASISGVKSIKSEKEIIISIESSPERVSSSSLLSPNITFSILNSTSVMLIGNSIRIGSNCYYSEFRIPIFTLNIVFNHMIPDKILNVTSHTVSTQLLKISTSIIIGENLLDLTGLKVRCPNVVLNGNGKIRIGKSESLVIDTKSYTLTMFISENCSNVFINSNGVFMTIIGEKENMFCSISYLTSIGSFRIDSYPSDMIVHIQNIHVLNDKEMFYLTGDSYYSFTESNCHCLVDNIYIDQAFPFKIKFDFDLTIPFFVKKFRFGPNPIVLLNKQSFSSDKYFIGSYGKVFDLVCSESTDFNSVSIKWSDDSFFRGTTNGASVFSSLVRNQENYHCLSINNSISLDEVSTEFCYGSLQMCRAVNGITLSNENDLLNINKYIQSGASQVTLHFYQNPPNNYTLDLPGINNVSLVIKGGIPLNHMNISISQELASNLKELSVFSMNLVCKKRTYFFGNSVFLSGGYVKTEKECDFYGVEELALSPGNPIDGYFEYQCNRIVYIIPNEGMLTIRNSSVSFNNVTFGIPSSSPEFVFVAIASHPTEVNCQGSGLPSVIIATNSYLSFLEEWPQGYIVTVANSDDFESPTIQTSFIEAPYKIDEGFHGTIVSTNKGVIYNHSIVKPNNLIFKGKEKTIFRIPEINQPSSHSLNSVDSIIEVEKMEITLNHYLFPDMIISKNINLGPMVFAVTQNASLKEGITINMNLSQNYFPYVFSSGFMPMNLYIQLDYDDQISFDFQFIDIICGSSINCELWKLINSKNITHQCIKREDRFCLAISKYDSIQPDQKIKQMQLLYIIVPSVVMVLGFVIYILLRGCRTKHDDTDLLSSNTFI